MRFMAQSLKRPVWIASATETGGVRQYGEPAMYLLNWRTMSTDAEMAAFGPEYMDYRQAVASNEVLTDIKRFDYAWMDTEPPVAADPLGKSADFYVYGVSPGAGGIGTILFKRLSPDG